MCSRVTVTTCCSAMTLILAGSATSLHGAVLPPIEFTIEAGPTLPAIPSHAASSNPASLMVVLFPELDSAIALDPSTAGGTLPPAFNAGGQARFVTIGDVDGDGLADLITTAPVTGRAHVVRQTANGNFVLGSVMPVGSTPFLPALTDLDNDGLPELIIPLRGESKIAVLPNLSNGLFAAGTRIDCAAQPDSVALADYNRDGIVDLAITCTGASVVQVSFGSVIDGSVQFGSPSTSLPTGNSPVGLAASDFDGDGWIDLATACTSSSSISVYYGGPGGEFQAGAFLFAGTSPQSLVTTDLDRSGLAEIIVANPSTQTLTVLQNNGDRTFTRSTIPMPFRPSRLAASDFDDDGMVDVFASSQTSLLTRLLRNTTEAAPCAGDVDNDLRVDLHDLNLVLANFSGSSDRADANGDGLVNLADLNIVLANFGTVCGES